MTLKAICEKLNIGPAALSELSGVPVTAIRGYYYKGQEPSYTRGVKVIKTLTALNASKGMPVYPGKILNLWRGGLV